MPDLSGPRLQDGFRAIIADELPLISDALASLCQSFTGCQVVGHCSSGEAAWDLMERLLPDVALLDLNLSHQYAIELIRRARDAGLQTKMLALSARADKRTVLDALRNGAHGFLLKTSSARQLEEAMHQVLLGGVYLSPSIDLNQRQNSAGSKDPLGGLSVREQQVFTLLVDGVRAKEIAARLALSPKTVDTYRASLMRKLDIHDVAGLVKFAIHNKMTRFEA